MPTLAGWLTGEQVPQETIEQTLTTMGTALGQYGGERAFTTQPGAGLIAFADTAYAMRQNTEPPVLDWVPNRRTLVYRRPLSGMHPLYYIEDWPAKGNLLFASEIKALLAVGVPRRLNLPALDALLRYGFIPAPWTAFQQIQSVPAGSLLRWQRAKTVMNHSTDYRFISDKRTPPTGELLEQLATRLDEATTSQLPAHDLLAALTGGDSASALVTWFASRQTEHAFTVATIDYKQGPGDSRAAERVASALNLPFLAITGVDQPEFWTAVIAAQEAPCVYSLPLALHQLLHTTAAETGARVALTGLGSGILLGSQEPLAARTKQQDILQWYRQTLSPETAQTNGQLWSRDAHQRLQREAPWEETLHARKLARQAAQLADAGQQRYYLDLHLRLPDLLVGPAQQLATVERVALRSPYLASTVGEILTRLPSNAPDNMSRQTFLTTLAQRYQLPSTKETSTLSLEAPTESLRQPDTSDLLEELLSPMGLLKTGIFDPRAVQTLLASPAAASSRELILVFTTQLLCRLFDASL